MAQSWVISQLECPICLDTFKDPRTLTPCLHTLCYECLQSHITHTGQDGTFTCPQCRESLLIPHAGADGFPKNFFFNSYIDAVKAETGARTKTRQASRRGFAQNLCSNSEELDDCGERENFCLDCCEYYCSFCSRVHRKLKATRSHILVALKDLTDDMVREAMCKSQAPKCLKHVDKLLELYCSTCAHAVCYLCARTEHHSHTCTDISEVDKRLKAELGDVMTSLTLLIEDSRKTHAGISRTQQVVETNTSSARETATKVFKRMQQMLSEKAKEIDQNICHIQKEGASKFGSLCKNQHLHTELLESLYTFVQDLLETGSVYNRLASVAEVRSRLQEFKSSPTKGTPPTQPPNSAALVSKQLDGFVLQEEFNLGGPGSDGLVLTCSITKNKTRDVRQKPAKSSKPTKVSQGRGLFVSADTPPQAAKVRVPQSGKHKLTVLMYDVYDLYWLTSVPVQDAARAVADTVECDVTETWEKQLQPVRADSLQVDVIYCWGDHINSVVDTFRLTEANTASRHLVLLHLSRGSQAQTLASLGDNRRLFKRVIQWDRSGNSYTAATDTLADYYRSVCQQSDDR